MEENTKDILEELVQEESAEKDFIVFYEMLMEKNIVDCLPEIHREKFTTSLLKLRDDSRRHYELMRKIISKYE